LNDIVDKIKNGKQLSSRELAIHAANTSNIEEKIKESDKKIQDNEKVESATEKIHITNDEIENNKDQINVSDDMLREGKEGNEKTDREQNEKELEQEHRSHVEKKVEESREEYTKEYKKCQSEMDRQKLIDKTRAATFNILAGVKNIFSKNKIEYQKSIKPEDYFTDKVKETQKEYNRARIEMGNLMFAEKKAELEKSGLSGKELETALAKYKATEILTKTIVEERQKIIDSKITNEKQAIWKKLLDGYRKMPRWQRVALSTALFTVAAGTGIATGGVFAGYGLASMAAMKFGTSMMMGGIVGNATKGIDLVMKKADLKFNEEQDNTKKELKEKFSKSEVDQEEYEKEIGRLELMEKKRARNRTLLKAGVGIAIAGIAGHYAYDAMGNGLHHVDSLQGSSVDTVNGPDINHIQHSPVAGLTTEHIPQHISIEATADHGQGSISMIHELQHNLKIEYGNNLENAPESVRHIIDTNPEQLSQEFGMYKPGQDAESAMIISGSSLTMDGHGNLIYHDQGTGNSITLMEGSDSNVDHMYGGKMSNTDHSGVENNITDEQKVPEQIDSIREEQIDTSDKPIYSINLDQKPEPVDSDIGEMAEENNNNFDNSNQEKSVIGNENTEIEKSVGLSEESIHHVHLIYEKNMNHLFPENDFNHEWDNVKDKIPGTLFKIEDEGGLNDTYKPLVSYLHKLQEITNIRPRESTIFDPIPETNEEYIERALQKAQEMGQLDKVKL